MVALTLLYAVASYTLLYAGLSGGTTWKRPWTPILQGLALNGTAPKSTSGAPTTTTTTAPQ